MIEIAVLTAAAGVILHIAVLILRFLLRDSSYNQMIILSGGKYVGNCDPLYHQLLDGVDTDNPTIIRQNVQEPVTSHFPSVYIGLYQLYTGRTYEGWLESELQVGRMGQQGEIPVLVLDDAAVSKKHCMFYRQGEQVMVKDLGSKNHTYVNGCRIQGAVPITEGDRLSLGNSEYYFRCSYQN